MINYVFGYGSLLERASRTRTNPEAVGAWPPISESHVEMDGAWALYEAWVRLQHGDIDSALVFSSGICSRGELREVLCLQNDPYYLMPLWADHVSLAALQARAVPLAVVRLHHGHRVGAARGTQGGTAGGRRNRVQRSDVGGRQRQGRTGDVLAQMLRLRGARDQQDVRRPLQQPGQGH